MAQSVADQLVATLAAAGVNRIYGIAGDSLNAITDSLRRNKAIEWVHAAKWCSSSVPTPCVPAPEGRHRTT